MNIDRRLFLILLRESSYSLLGKNDFMETDIIEFIIKYSDLNVIKYTDGIISLTEYGKDYLIRNRRRIFLVKTKKEWEKIPTIYIGRCIDINTPVKLKLKGVWHTNH
jgi:hypothetical protein